MFSKPLAEADREDTMVLFSLLRVLRRSQGCSGTGGQLDSETL